MPEPGNTGSSSFRNARLPLIRKAICLHLVGGLADGPGCGDQGTHRTAGHQIYRDAFAFQNANDTDVRQAASGAGAQRQAHQHVSQLARETAHHEAVGFHRMTYHVRRAVHGGDHFGFRNPTEQVTDWLSDLLFSFPDVRRALFANRGQDHSKFRRAGRGVRLEVFQQQPGLIEMLVVILGDDEHIVRLNEAGKDRWGHLVGKIANDIVVTLDQMTEDRRDQRNLAFVTQQLQVQSVVTQRRMHDEFLQAEPAMEIEPLAFQQGHAALFAAEIEQQHRLARFVSKTGSEIVGQRRLAGARQRAVEGNDRAPFRALLFFAQLFDAMTETLAEADCHARITFDN